MAWHVDTAVQPDHTVHVWPDADLIEHDLTGQCVCVLVSHHSLDGRELTEPA